MGFEPTITASEQVKAGYRDGPMAQQIGPQNFEENSCHHYILYPEDGDSNFRRNICVYQTTWHHSVEKS
jgi:hypothetical protein